jgi:hypothetical protein
MLDVMQERRGRAYLVQWLRELRSDRRDVMRESEHDRRAADGVNVSVASLLTSAKMFAK